MLNVSVVDTFLLLCSYSIEVAHRIHRNAGEPGSGSNKGKGSIAKLLL